MAKTESQKSWVYKAYKQKGTDRKFAPAACQLLANKFLLSNLSLKYPPINPPTIGVELKNKFAKLN